MANQAPASWIKVIEWLQEQKFRPDPKISIQQAQDRFSEALSDYFKKNAPDEVRKNKKSPLYTKYTLKNKRKNQVDQMVQDMVDIWMDKVFTPFVVPYLKVWAKLTDNSFDKLIDTLFESAAPNVVMPKILETMEMRERGETPDEDKEDENLPDPETVENPNYWKELGGRAVKVAGGALVAAAAGRTDLFSGIVKGGAALYGLHEWAKESKEEKEKKAAKGGGKSGMTPRTANANAAAGVDKEPDAPEKKSVWGTLKSAASSMFGGNKEAAKDNTADFTPSEEKTEAAADQKKMIGLLEKIEKNTRGGMGKVADKGKGIIEKLMDFAHLFAGKLGKIFPIIAELLAALGMGKMAARVAGMGKALTNWGARGQRTTVPEGTTRTGHAPTTGDVGKGGTKGAPNTSEPTVNRGKYDGWSKEKIDAYEKARAEGKGSGDALKEANKADAAAKAEAAKPNAKGSGVNGPERAREAILDQQGRTTSPNAPKPSTTVPETGAPNTSSPSNVSGGRGSRLLKSGMNVAKGLGKGLVGMVGGMALDYGAEAAAEAGHVKTAAGLDIASSALSGAGYGAMLGSFVPVIGTGIGAAVGGGIGAGMGLYKNWSTIFSSSNSTENNTEVKPVTESGSPQQAMQFFIGKGWSPAQAAGIVGNLQVESPGLKTDAKGDGGKAYGIAQWGPARQADFKNTFKKDIRETSLKEQLEFVHWELTHTHREAGNKLRTANTAEEAAVIVEKMYEKPSIPHRDRRVNNALALMKNETSNVNVANNSRSASGVISNTSNVTTEGNTSAPSVTNSTSSSQQVAMASNTSTTVSAPSVTPPAAQRVSGLESAAPQVEEMHTKPAPTIINAPTTNNQNVTQSGGTTNPRTADNSFQRLLDRRQYAFA